MIKIHGGAANFGQDDRLITSPRDCIESEPGDEHEDSDVY